MGVPVDPENKEEVLLMHRYTSNILEINSKSLGLFLDGENKSNPPAKSSRTKSRARKPKTRKKRPQNI